MIRFFEYLLMNAWHSEQCVLNRLKIVNSMQSLFTVQFCHGLRIKSSFIWAVIEGKTQISSKYLLQK